MLTVQGMKVSCTHFQCAAWAFEHLRDHIGCSNMSTDLAHEFLTFHINVMLAQAQECILEKSMIDSRKNTITAKVIYIYFPHTYEIRHLDFETSKTEKSIVKDSEITSFLDLKFFIFQVGE